MYQAVDALQEELLLAIDSHELVLPSLPEICLRVRAAAEAPDTSLHTLSKLISYDVALTARLIKVVNSPLLRSGGRPITDLLSAVGRLGLNQTCSLATGLALEQLFQAESAQIDQKLRQLWNGNMETAAICHALCRCQTQLQPEQAALSGLLHRIGALPILTYLDSHSEQLSDENLDALIDKLHPLFGERLLSAWDFPPSLSSLPREYQQFERASPQTDYLDILQVALLYGYLGRQEPYASGDWSQYPAFARLHLDPHSRLQQLPELAAEVQETLHMLQ